jgi:hypothetical protein
MCMSGAWRVRSIRCRQSSDDGTQRLPRVATVDRFLLRRNPLQKLEIQPGGCGGRFASYGRAAGHGDRPSARTSARGVLRKLSSDCHTQSFSNAGLGPRLLSAAHRSCGQPSVYFELRGIAISAIRNAGRHSRVFLVPQVQGAQWELGGQQCEAYWSVRRRKPVAARMVLMNSLG